MRVTLIWLAGVIVHLAGVVLSVYFAQSMRFSDAPDLAFGLWAMGHVLSLAGAVIVFAGKKVLVVTRKGGLIAALGLIVLAVVAAAVSALSAASAGLQILAAIAVFYSLRNTPCAKSRGLWVMVAAVGGMALVLLCIHFGVNMIGGRVLYRYYWPRVGVLGVVGWAVVFVAANVYAALKAKGCEVRMRGDWEHGAKKTFFNYLIQFGGSLTCMALGLLLMFYFAGLYNSRYIDLFFLFPIGLFAFVCALTYNSVAMKNKKGKRLLYAIILVVSLALGSAGIAFMVTTPGGLAGWGQFIIGLFLFGLGAVFLVAFLLALLLAKLFKKGKSPNVPDNAHY